MLPIYVWGKGNSISSSSLKLHIELKLNKVLMYCYDITICIMQTLRIGVKSTSH